MFFWLVFDAMSGWKTAESKLQKRRDHKKRKDHDATKASAQEDKGLTKACVMMCMISHLSLLFLKCPKTGASPPCDVVLQKKTVKSVLSTHHGWGFDVYWAASPGVCFRPLDSDL